jgi:arginine/serine-rich splicing factor 7
MPKRSRIYVGGLSRRTGTRTLERIFTRYGRIRDLDLKSDYAFIVLLRQEFSDHHDAEDAIEDMHRRTVDGAKISVELAGSRRERGSGSKDTCYNCGKTGHWYALRRASECKAGDCRGRCYRCGGRGHERKDCRVSRSRSRSPKDSSSVPSAHQTRSQSPEKREEYD